MAVRIEQKIKRARRASALSQINGGGSRHARRRSLGSAEDAGTALTPTTTAASQQSGARRMSALELTQASRSAKALEDALPRTRTVPLTQALEAPLHAPATRSTYRTPILQPRPYSHPICQAPRE